MRPGVLSKPGRLDDAELAEVRAHPVEGAWLIAGVPSLAAALPYVLFHHERWDGGGYPTRRAGLEIPLEGRLLAVADAFDAMTSARPYCDARAFDGAVAEVERCSGTQFDPDDRRRIRRGVRGGRDRRRRAALRRRLSCAAAVHWLQPDAGSIDADRCAILPAIHRIRRTFARSEIVA